MNYTGRYKKEVPARSNTLAESKLKYNGLAYLTVKSDSNATHWMPLDDENNEHSNVTVGKLYRLYLDEYEKDHVITNDNNVLSTIFLCHNGKFIILQESQQWWSYVENLYVKEWRQTDEYKQMMKESYEAVRESWERD